jgi:pyrroline-5-carboxylate reductase
MKTKTLGFIGGGRVTKIFLQAFSNKNEIFKSVAVYDPNTDVLKSLKKAFPDITFVDAASIAARQDYVFIALHPPVIMETLEKIQNEVNKNTTVFSLAPKITIDKIRGKLSQTARVIRLIPNATSYINKGYNPVCFSDEFSAEEKKSLLDFLGLLGHTFEVAENKLEAYAIMSAMLPTYFWFQWRELSDIGIKLGLTEKEASDSVNETISAALSTMFESGLSASEVIDLIPVKPIAEHEMQISEIYRSKLIALFEKIKP